MILFKKYVQKRVECISISISMYSDEKGRRQKKIGFTDMAIKACHFDRFAGQ
jgi:hypothetical protein